MLQEFQQVKVAPSIWMHMSDIYSIAAIIVVCTPLVRQNIKNGEKLILQTLIYNIDKTISVKKRSKKSIKRTKETNYYNGD